MDTRLYETKLANHKLFKDIKESFSEYSGAKLRNLIELQDDVLYVWNSIENCLFCLNLKHLEEHIDETEYQKLHLLSPPAFPVERIISSECGTRICVWGSRGVTVAELPTRWGRCGLFESGSQTVLCKSYTLDERLMYAKGEVHRVRWHPKSLSHLLVLLSNNTLRLYNIALKTGPIMVKSFSIGPKPIGSLGMTLLDSFGDSAVDFTPTPDNEHLLILSGNGDVYMMNSDFLDSKSPLQIKLRGPLAMYPPADDNYGSESCAIMTMGAGECSTVVVIASATASLYHCLLLPNGPDNDDSDSYALYVIESVELNIVLNSKDDVPLAYPVHLYPCLGNTYACMHAGGVHSVTLPIMGHLNDLSLAEESEIESILSLISTKSGVARHLICTSSDKACPPVGLVLAPPLYNLLILCTTGELFTRNLEPYLIEEVIFREMQNKNPALNNDDLHNLLKERQKLSFVTIIQEILCREVSQPILNMNKSQDLGSKELLEMLTEVTVKLREQYITRQSRANNAMTSKIRALCSLQTQQLAWQEDLLKEIQNVQLQSAVLIEKRNLAEKRQEDIKYRCSSVIRTLRSSSNKSPAELEMLRQLETYKQKASQLQSQTRSLKEHADKHIQRIKNWQEEYKKKDIALGKSHSDTISSILQQQTQQISTLIEETKLLKDQLGVV